MKKYILFTLLLGWSFYSFALTPQWVKHLPNAENDTYYYVVESATASTEDAARNKATALVLQRAVQSLGLSYDSKKVENALRSGTLESNVENFSIPVKKMCTYRQKVRGGGIRVYVLYQVAVSGNTEAHFTAFNDCGSQGSGDDDISMRPEEWRLWEGDAYFNVSDEKKLGRGEKSYDAAKELENEVKSKLIANLIITDDVLSSMIETKNAYDENSKTVFAIAYIEKDKIVNYYQNYLTEEMKVVDDRLNSAESRIQAEDVANAQASLRLIQNRLDAMKPIFSFLRAYAPEYIVQSLAFQCQYLISKHDQLGSTITGDFQSKRENKVREFSRNGYRALSSANIGDALRYYYGAQMLLADLPNATTFTDSVPTPGGIKLVTMNTYLQQRIKRILKNIVVVCDGYYGDSETEIKMSFYYRDSTASSVNYKAVNGLKFTYNDNSRWSECMTVKNGWSVITTKAGNKPQNIHVKCEYRYEDEAIMDPELQEKMQMYKGRYQYDEWALQIVEFQSKKAVSNSSAAASVAVSGGKVTMESTDVNQNVVVDKVKESSHCISDQEASFYGDVIYKVCDAIQSKEYPGVFTLFTADGYDQFSKLIQYGQARIISRQSMKFVKLGTDIQCRSIPMEFSFKKGHKIIENVVFTFNETQKIDGVQFALEERAARNIMGDTRYNETAKLMLVNFMENYKTAFALKRLDYIESIFSDNALIITGRVLHNSERVDDNQLRVNRVVYSRQTKSQYISRLRTSFASKEWINIQFGNTVFEKSAQGEQFGIKLHQDYFSSNYGDRGNLFLLIDCQDPEHPLIRVRVWEAELGEKAPFSLTDYDNITHHSY